MGYVCIDMNHAIIIEGFDNAIMEKMSKCNVLLNVDKCQFNPKTKKMP